MKIHLFLLLNFCNLKVKFKLKVVSLLEFEIMSPFWILIQNFKELVIIVWNTICRCYLLMPTYYYHWGIQHKRTDLKREPRSCESEPLPIESAKFSELIVCQTLPNFGELVIGCIEADFEIWIVTCKYSLCSI